MIKRSFGFVIDSLALRELVCFLIHLRGIPDMVKKETDQKYEYETSEKTEL